MRINGRDPCQRVGGTGQKPDPKNASDLQRPRGAEGNDRHSVVLGDRASKMTDKLSADDAAREGKLSEIKRQLDDGTYTVDLDVLAERLVDEELARAAPGGSK